MRIDVPSKGENYVFACHRWLDKKEEDGQLEIEMEPTHFQKGASSKNCHFKKFLTHFFFVFKL